MTEARLRELYAVCLAARRPPDRVGCPAPETLQSLARREGVEEERFRTLDHAMSCADCRADLDLLRSVERAGRELAGTGRSVRRSWLMPAALAASVLLAFGVGRLALAPGSGDETVRGSEIRGVTLLAPPTEAPAGTRLAFVWRPVPGATRYRLEVLSAAGEVAFEAETRDTLVTLEPARQLEAGEYQWWVSAAVSPAASRSELRPLRLTTK